MRPTPRQWIPGLVACGFVAVVGQSSGSLADQAGIGGELLTAQLLATDVVVWDTEDIREATLRQDVRARAFERAYEELIDSIVYRNDDLVFYLGGTPIHFQHGRMLAESRLHRRDRCDSIFYAYPLDMPTEPEPLPDGPVRFCTDVQEVMWGRTENQIRRNARSATFVDRKVFVNHVVADALADVEAEVLAAARTDAEVAAWIDEVDVAYSFIDRGIAGTATRSQHSWGLAVDFVPNSYEGRQVYWRWTRAWNRNGWHEVPMEERWSPPAAVVQIFEQHGFLWGGKWAHYDNIHFEYRPEILEYSRLLAAEAQD